MSGGRRAWWWGALVREGDVDEGCDAVDGWVVLGMAGKVALARLVFGVPVEYVEL